MALINSLRYIPNNKKTILVLGFGLLLILGGLIYQIWAINSRPLTPYNSTSNRALVQAEPLQQILVFSFDVAGEQPSVSLRAIDQYNGRPQVAETTSNRAYSFSVIENDVPAYVTYFELSDTHVEQFHDDGTISSEGTVAEDSLAFRTPRFKDGSTYIIRNNKNKIILEGTIENVTIHNNEPDYKSTVGE